MDGKESVSPQSHQKQRVLFIHGVGDEKPGWLNKKQLEESLLLEGKDPNDYQLEEFSYDDLLDRSFINNALRALTLMYLPLISPWGEVINDPLAYLLSNRTKHKIQERLKRAIEAQEDNVIIVAHSQGSFVAYEALQASRALCRRVDQLITIGSPLATSYMRHLDRIPWLKKNIPTLEKLPVQWVNIYGSKDWALSAKIFQADWNERVNCNHDFYKYFYYCVEFL